MKVRISLAGSGAVTALGHGVEPLRLALQANACALSVSNRPANPAHRAIHSGWVPPEIATAAQAAFGAADEVLASALAFSAIQQAHQSAPQVFSQVPPARRGLVLSTTKGGIHALEKIHRGLPCSALEKRHLHPALMAADLAARTDLHGPVQCVSVACISGLLALQQGVELIANRQADLVTVAGVDVISDFVLAGFSTLKSLAPEGCRPFDAKRTGLSLGEGAAAIVLVREDLAPLSSPFVVGYSSSNDANHLTGPSRDGSGLALAMSRALAMAGSEPGTIDYIHLHGTGTPYNDAMESLAVASLFGANVPPFGASKGLLGHTLGAAGVLETVMCCLALEHRFMPGTPRLEMPDPVTPASILRQPKAAPDLRTILKVNCGFGGTNAALVLTIDSSSKGAA